MGKLFQTSHGIQCVLKNLYLLGGSGLFTCDIYVRDINSRKSYQDSSSSFRPSPFRIHVFRIKKTPQIQKKQSKPKEPLHIVLKGPPPEMRRWRPTSRAPVDFFVCKVRWALPKGGRALASGTPKDKTIYFQNIHTLF